MKYYSGFGHPNKRPPYGTLNKVGSVLDSYDSFGNRFESSTWLIKLVTTDYKSLDNEIDRVYNLLNDEPPICQNRIVEEHEFSDARVIEAEPGIYVADIFYRVEAQRPFASRTIYKPIGTWKFHDLLSDKLDHVISTSLGVPSWKRPFAFVPAYQRRPEFDTTCERIERRSFDLCVSHNDCFQLDLLLDHVDDLMSYAIIEDSNQRNILMEWQGNKIVAEKPGLWKGSITYDMLMQRAL